LAVGTEDPLGTVVFMMVPKNMNTAGKQGRRDHFPFIPGHLLTVPGEIDFPSFRNFKNWMFINAMLCHNC
jgi:hypothetical protein